MPICQCFFHGTVGADFAEIPVGCSKVSSTCLKDGSVEAGSLWSKGCTLGKMVWQTQKRSSTDLSMQHQVQGFHHSHISGKVVQLFSAKRPLAASALPPKLLMQHPWIDDRGDCGLGVLFIYRNVTEFEDVLFPFFFFFFFKTPFLPRFEHGMICSTTATPVEEAP